MWTIRRAILAATGLACLLLLVRTLLVSSTEATTNEQPGQGDGRYTGRLYPAPFSAKEKAEKEKQLEENFRPRSLKERLQYQYPYNLEVKFPAFIWQTWKYDPSSSHFDDNLRPYEASWTEKHPEFVHEVVTDENAGYLINYLYAAVPEVVEAYKAMPLPVLKADFFRYLILFARGGIYSDIDTMALKGDKKWLPDNYDRSQVGLVIGIEADPDRPDWADYYSRRIQFVQWTIQAKPGHPVLSDIVATITEDTLNMTREGKLTKGRLPSKSIVEFTGPAVWTDSVFRYFNDPKYFDATMLDASQTNVSWEQFTGMNERKKIGDVIVLPITCFSPGVGHMGAGDFDDPMAFVRHSFEGTWKPENERNPMNAA